MKEIFQLEKKLCRPVSCWSLKPRDSLDQERRLQCDVSRVMKRSYTSFVFKGGPGKEGQYNNLKVDHIRAKDIF